MRVARRSLLLVVAALFATLLSSGAASSAGMQSVADVKGRFRIAFPADWKVATPPTDTPAVAAFDPQSSLPYLNVNVVIEQLPQPLSPDEYGRLSKPLMAATFHDFTVIDEGPARIAQRESYYRYYTWRTNTGDPLYQVQAFFTVGRQGFVLTGTTLNDPSRIQKDVPIISQIFETFVPTTP